MPEMHELYAANLILRSLRMEALQGEGFLGWLALEVLIG